MFIRILFQGFRESDEVVDPDPVQVPDGGGQAEPQYGLQRGREPDWGVGEKQQEPILNFIHNFYLGSKSPEYPNFLDFSIYVKEIESLKQAQRN